MKYIIVNMRNVYIDGTLSVIGGLMCLAGFLWVPQLMFAGVMVVLFSSAFFPPFKIKTPGPRAKPPLYVTPALGPSKFEGNHMKSGNNKPAVILGAIGVFLIWAGFEIYPGIGIALFLVFAFILINVIKA